MPLHPALVHFPIALLSVSGVLYLLNAVRDSSFYAKTAYLMHQLGIFGLIIAIFSGLQAEPSEALPESVDAVLSLHEIMGYTAIWLYLMLLGWHFLRKGKQRTPEKMAFAIVFILVTVVMLYGASMGGELVYEHGVGVEVSPSS